MSGFMFLEIKILEGIQYVCGHVCSLEKLKPTVTLS